MPRSSTGPGQFIDTNSARVSDKDCRFDILTKEDVGLRPHLDQQLVAFKVLLGPGIVICPDDSWAYNDGKLFVDQGCGIQLDAGATIVLRGEIEEADEFPDALTRGLLHKGPTLAAGEQRLAVRVFTKMPEGFPRFPED